MWQPEAQSAAALRLHVTVLLATGTGTELIIEPVWRTIVAFRSQKAFTGTSISGAFLFCTKQQRSNCFSHTFKLPTHSPHIHDTSHNMPRRSSIYYREPKEWFPCPVRGCSQKFRTQTGQTKHIRAKHKKNELQTQTRGSLSVSSKIPLSEPVPASPDVSSFDSDATTSYLPTDRINTQSPIQLPNDNDLSSPPPLQPEVEIYHDQAEQVPSHVSSTDYHLFINGITQLYLLVNWC